MGTIKEILVEAERLLAGAGVDDARRDSATLTASAISRDRTFLIAHPEYELTERETAIARSFFARRAAREPLQQIRGVQEFFGLEFAVTPDVLIPRPETEVLVERAIELLQGTDAARFLDIGVGSGCISISILHNVPGATAVAADVSPAAIAVASRNAAAIGVTDRIEFLGSDVFESVPSTKFGLIVSNPPYVHPDDIGGLQPEVRDHEPLVALTDGSDGLSIIERLIAEAPRYMVPGASLLVEVGFGQSEEVLAMASADIWAAVGMLPDLQGIPRVLDAKLR